MTTAHKYTGALFIGAAFALASFMPLTAAAATSKKPTCEVTVTTKESKTKITDKTDKKEMLVAESEEIEFKWKSKDAKKATLDGKKIKLTGTNEINAKKTGTYEFEFENGSKTVTCEVTITVADAEITSKLANTSSKPTFSGTAEGLKKVSLSVFKEGAKKAVFVKKNVSVKNGKWTVKTSKPLATGTYEVRLMNGDTMLDTADLTVGSSTKNKDDKAVAKSNGVLKVGMIPLGIGGTSRAGGSVSAALVEVRNTGTEAVTVTGFRVSQRGTASTNAIVELSSKDDKGMTSASTKASWKSNATVAPANAVIAAGGVKLFTVKALLGASAMPGTTVILDVTGIESNAKTASGTFPIRGNQFDVTY